MEPRAVRNRVRRVPIAPGFYTDPGGAGIREWTGTEWSPFLTRSPVGNGLAEGSDPPSTWSPLPLHIQHEHWNLAIKAPAEAVMVIALFLSFAVMTAFCAVLAAVVGPEVPALVGVFAASAVGLLVPAVVMIRKQPARRRIAEAAEKALTLASRERGADA